MKKHFHPNWSIGIKLYEFVEGELMPTHCPLPWIHLATHPQGDVSFCCRVDFKERRGMAYDTNKNGERYFYNLNHDKIEDVLNSGSFKKARLEMLRGEKPPACRGCYKDEEVGLVSKRMRENAIFNLSFEELRSRTNELGEIKPRIVYAELRLGNLCNVKCRTCNPFSSSKWVAEYRQVQQKLAFVNRYDAQVDFTWAENDKFWTDFLKNAGELRLLYINGGEPTLIKQHWSFLERLVKLNYSHQIDIKYNMNMTYIPDNAFSIWKNFKSVYVGASIDDLQDRNSYIRYGTEWDKLLQNLNSIRSAGFHVALEQTVSVYNIFYLDEMELFCKTHNLGYGLNFVYDPNFLSIQCLPHKIRNIILAKLHHKIQESFFDEISAHFKAPEDLDLWNKFKLYNQQLDQNRDENFKNIFPEFCAVLSSEGYL